MTYFSETFEKEVLGYLLKLKIEPLCVTYIKYVAVAQYIHKNMHGLMYIFKDETGRINSTNSTCSKTKPVSVMISTWADIGKDDISIVAVLINEEQIIKNASKIRVKFANGEEYIKKVSNEKGIIIDINGVDTEVVSLSELEIMDISGDRIYYVNYL